MKTISKQIGGLFTFGVLGVFLFLASCNKQEIESINNLDNNRAAEEEEERITPEQLAYVGIEHNAQLDGLYNAFLDDGVSEDMSKEYARTFLLGQVGSGDPEIDSAATANINNFFDNPIVSYEDNFYPGELEDQLSPTIKSYLDDLHAILSIDGISVADLHAEVSVLETTIYEDMSLENNELCMLFSTTQMAKYSYDYWTNEGYKWTELSADTTAVKGDPAGDIAKSDVGGAAGGAAGAWVVNVIPGLGQVAYGTAIVGGTVGASVASGVRSLIGWIWG